MKELIKRAKQLAILILALSFTTCDNDDDNNLPQVVAGFTYTINIDTGTVSFINTSENSNTYSWDFGDGTTSTQINPIKTYENGTYTITLEAENAAGASNTFEDEITILIPEIATLPISFDGENTSYDAVTFGGASFEVVDNPDPSGTNTSTSKVGAVTNIGAEWEGFYFDLGADLDLSTLGSVSMNFWADSPVDVLMKLEEGTAASIETTASHGGTGWETIIFSFDSADSYSRLTMFVDGPGTTAGTFYLDDITQVETPPDPCTEETEQSLDATDFNLTFQTDPTSSIGSFDAQLSYISNPDFDNEVNKSCYVGQIDRDGGALFANNQIDFDSKFDFTSNSGFQLKVWSPVAGTNVLLKLEDKTDDTINTEVGAVTSAASAWEELTFDFPGSESNKYDKIILFFELNTNTTETYYIDDFRLYGEGSGSGGGGTFDGGLLTNGDFETGDTTGWIGNAANVQTEGGNSFNFANVDNAGQPFDVNLSQVVEIIEGKTYTLSFDASSDGNRTMLAGIGLNEAPWTNFTETVNLTTDTQTFTYEFTATGFGGANSRVIFDMGADTGVVVIDNVSLFCNDCDGGGGGGTFDDGLLTNGDFETGDGTGWTGNALNVQTEGGNSFNLANVDNAGQPFDVNLSQVVEIIEGKTYTLSFDSSSDGNRTMLAGIGLNEAPWTNFTETVNLTTDTQTFTYEFTATGFGGANSRVIFDMGADTGVVVIDNVSLFCDDCDSGGGGGGTGDNIATNGDFETGDETGWILFQNGGTAVLDNSINNGGSWSGRLETNGPSNPAFKQEAIASGTVAAGDEVQIQFDHIGAIGGEGGVFNVILFGEGAGGASFTHVFNPGPSLSDSWSTFTGSYTIPGGTDVSGGISFLIETVCGGATGCTVTANIDNVSVILNPQ